MSHFQTVKFFWVKYYSLVLTLETTPHEGPAAAMNFGTSNKLLATDWYQHLKQLKNNLSGDSATLPPGFCQHWLHRVDAAIHFHLPYSRTYYSAPAWNHHPVIHGFVQFTSPSRSTKTATTSPQVWGDWVSEDIPGSLTLHSVPFSLCYREFTHIAPPPAPPLPSRPPPAHCSTQLSERACLPTHTHYLDFPSIKLPLWTEQSAH